MEVGLAINTDERHSNYVSQVFAHIMWDIYKMFVSFKNVLGTNTSRTDHLPGPKEPKSCSEIPMWRYVWL